MISFACPKCDKVLKVKDELAGKRGKCPSCGQSVVAPAPETTRGPVRRESTLAGRDLDDSPESPPDLSESDQGTPPPGLSGAAAESSESETLSPKPQEQPPTELTEFLAPPQAADELGRLGPYRVLKVLGQGGMGVVFLAEDPQLQRRVALKALLPALAPSGAARQRFLREARSAAAIRHDRIVTIFQVGEDRGAPYLAMEFLEGQPLDERLKSSPPLSMPEILRIGRQVAEGLAAAHDQGMIHRDIKPANIWLEKTGAKTKGLAAPGYRVKILDFGLARGTGSGHEITQTGAIVGTPAYMAPEQGQGQEVDARTDLFSLGCVLYRMCTGTLPFQGKDAVALLVAVATTTPTEPHKVAKEVSVEFSNLIMGLLEKDPGQRPRSAQEVVEALRALSGESTGPLPVLTRKKSTRKKPWLLVGALVGLAAATVLFFLLRGGGQAPPPPPGPGPIPQEELALAGNGDAARAPKSLVAVLGQTGKEKNPVREMGLGTDGSTLTLVDAKGVVELWDLKLAEKKKTYKKPITLDVPLALSPDGGIMVYLEGNKLRFWNILEGSEDEITTVAISKGNKNICILPGGYAAVSNSFIDLQNKKKLFSRPNMWYAAISPFNKFFVSGGPLKAKKNEVTDKKTKIEFIDFAHVAGLKTDQFKIVFTPVFIIYCKDDLRQNILFSPDGRFLATIPAQGGSIELYDLNQKGDDKLVQCKGHEQPVENVAFHPESRLLASCGQDLTIRFWDPVAGKQLEVIHLGSVGMNLTHLAFTPDGKHLAVANDYGSIYLLRTPEFGEAPVKAGAGVEGQPQFTIKEVMLKAMKSGLVGKVAKGQAMDQEKKDLVIYLRALHANPPPKGELTDWQKITGPLLQAAEDAALGYDPGELTKYSNCAICHKAHKGK